MVGSRRLLRRMLTPTRHKNAMVRNKAVRARVQLTRTRAGASGRFAARLDGGDDERSHWKVFWRKQRIAASGHQTDNQA